MARPAEKARAMMNKWTAMRNADNSNSQGRVRSKRPHLASDCEHLADVERYRGQILREIEAGIAKIQNPAMGEHAMRELNDEINHKMREKWHWNRRIRELGGLDFNAIEKQRQIEEGDTQRSSGYRYFGAAKDLPGVRELLAKEAAKHQKTKRTDLYKNITPDYYGWRDEEDGVLLEIEAMADVKDATLQTQRNKKKRRLGKPKTGEDDKELEEQEDYLAIPTQQEIERILLEHKKKALLEKYAL